MNMDMIVGIVVGLIIAFLAMALMAYRAEAALRREIVDLVETVKSQTEKHIILARVEQHRGVFYIYDTANDHFLAQGDTVAELKQALERRFHDKHVVVTQGESSVLEQIKSFVKEQSHG